jgi:uncharacterized protein
MPVSTFRGTNRPTALALAALLAASAGCRDTEAPTAAASRSDAAGPGAGTHVQYGVPVKVGNGRARTYVVLDQKTGAQLELGLALDERALENLPAGGHGAHGPMTEYLLQLPAQNRSPFRFVEVDWNPMGHGAPYETPHFDFHFYTIPVEERNAIDPTDPAFASKAAHLPAADLIPAGYVSSHQLLGKTPAEVSVPRMGLHWLDLSSPELPPQSKPFTATYIVGTWNGNVIFQEPMITRAFILGLRDGRTSAAAFAVPRARRYEPAGLYPSGYRVSWDAARREFRIALTGLEPRR